MKRTRLARLQQMREEAPPGWAVRCSRQRALQQRRREQVQGRVGQKTVVPSEFVLQEKEADATDEAPEKRHPVLQEA